LFEGGKKIDRSWMQTAFSSRLQGWHWRY